MSGPCFLCVQAEVPVEDNAENKKDNKKCLRIILWYLKINPDIRNLIRENEKHGIFQSVKNRDIKSYESWLQSLLEKEVFMDLPLCAACASCTRTLSEAITQLEATQYLMAKELEKFNNILRGAAEPQQPQCPSLWEIMIEKLSMKKDPTVLILMNAFRNQLEEKCSGRLKELKSTVVEIKRSINNFEVHCDYQEIGASADRKDITDSHRESSIDSDQQIYDDLDQEITIFVPKKPPPIVIYLSSDSDSEMDVEVLEKENVQQPTANIPTTSTCTALVPYVPPYNFWNMDEQIPSLSSQQMRISKNVKKSFIRRRLQRRVPSEIIKCDDCDKTFSSAYRKSVHMVKVHLGRRWKCTFCTEKSKKFVTLEKLRKHITNFHKDRV